MPVTTEIVRELIRNELMALGLIPHKEKSGLPVVFSCHCGRPTHTAGNPCGELHVIPVKVEGVRSVDLRTIGTGGVILDQEQRDTLADLLRDETWFGDHADLGA